MEEKYKKIDIKKSQHKLYFIQFSTIFSMVKTMNQGPKIESREIIFILVKDLFLYTWHSIAETTTCMQMAKVCF